MEHILEGVRSILSNKVQLKLSIPLHLMLLLIFLAEDIGIDIPEPDAMAAPAVEPLWRRGLVGYEGRPDWTASQLAASDSCMESDSSALQILEDGEDMLEAVVDDFALEESPFAWKTDIFGSDSDGQRTSRFQGTKSAVEEDHFFPRLEEKSHPELRMHFVKTPATEL